MNIRELLKDIGEVIKMSKGFSYYYRIECYSGFRNNKSYEGKTFNEVFRKFTGRNKSIKSSEIQDFVKKYDDGETGAYYHIHCVFVYPDGTEKIIYTARGL